MANFETQFPLKTPERIEEITQWWAAFKEAESDIVASFSKGSDFDLVSFMRTHLDPIHPDMMWEFGKGLTKTHRLAIAPEGDRRLMPLAQVMVDMAPADIAHFDIILSRPAYTWDEYSHSFDGGRETWKTADGIYFTCDVTDQNLIDVMFYTGSKNQDDSTLTNCFLMTEALLGEQVVSDWLGSIDVTEAPPKKLLHKHNPATMPAGSHPASKLKDIISAKIARIKNGLPSQPFYERVNSGTWQLMQMKPRSGDDLPKMDDLVVMTLHESGAYIPLYNGQNRFYSNRFSAHGETYAYIKIDRTDDIHALDNVENRGKIEAVINSVIQPQGYGCVIGGGTGRQYSYIFLALTDLARSVKNMRKALRGEKMPWGCWILFHDVSREQEWIGIWKDTPAPPLPAYDD